MGCCCFGGGSQIPHHAGAVNMCAILTALATAVDPDLADLCANITRNQIDEIMSLNSWLATATAESSDAASVPCADGHGGHGSGGSGMTMVGHGGSGSGGNGSLPTMPGHGSSGSGGSHGGMPGAQGI